MQRKKIILCMFLSSNFLVAMNHENIQEDQIVKTVSICSRLTKTKMITYKSGKTIRDIWKVLPNF